MRTTPVGFLLESGRQMTIAAPDHRGNHPNRDLGALNDRSFAEKIKVEPHALSDRTCHLANDKVDSTHFPRAGFTGLLQDEVEHILGDADFVHWNKPPGKRRDTVRAPPLYEPEAGSTTVCLIRTETIVLNTDY